ncbi:MAG: HAD hydrolase family protein, partial [Malacoplasma sp.]
MFYKMAFIDLDGTLLSLFDRISLSNLKSLKKYKYLGGEIVLCTGRWPISAYKINTILENYNGKKNRYLVCLNGALIYDLLSKKTIRKEFIESSICEKILNIRKEF